MSRCKTTRRPIYLLTSLAILLLAVPALAGPGQGQVRDAAKYSVPLGLYSSHLSPAASVERVSLPALDVVELLEQDRAAAMKDQPLRFAVPQPVFRGLGKGGLWETMPDGRHVWRLVLEAKGAMGIAPVFDRFYLPPGAELHLYAADGSQRVRPFTSADNRADGELWAPLVTTEELVVELVLPRGARSQAKLHISEVGHAYRDLSGRTADKYAEKSGACNIDVACTLGQEWGDEVRGVAQIQIGFFVCTGFLVNNTAQDDRLLFMTADHCGVTTANDQNVLAFWNYENSTCRTPGSTQSGTAGDGIEDEFTMGLTVLGSDSRSDFTITEMMQSPAAYNVYLLGWDARKIAPASAVTIHHPQGEEKRISREFDATFFDIYPDPSVPADTDSHIQVPDWDEGTTEGGSSGSPLFDETTRRVVGQLHGGLAACGNDLPDWYGAMWRSFELGLGDFLDPTGSGAQFLDGRNLGGGTPDPDPDPDPEPDPDDPPDVDPFTCVENGTTLCLNEGRYQVKASWMDFFGNANAARAVTTPEGDSGMFWFFTPENLELIVKVLDSCNYNDRYWFFAAGATNVEYTLTVTDSATGKVKLYRNPLGMIANAVTDIDAFATCP